MLLALVPYSVANGALLLSSSQELFKTLTSRCDPVTEVQDALGIENFLAGRT